MAELCERQLLKYADGNGKPQTVHNIIKGINDIIMEKEEQQPVEKRHLARQHPPQQQPQKQPTQPDTLPKISKSKKRNERRKNLKKKYWEAAKNRAKGKTVKRKNFKRNNHGFRKNYSNNIYINCKGGIIVTGNNHVINMNINC